MRTQSKSPPKTPGSRSNAPVYQRSLKKPSVATQPRFDPSNDGHFDTVSELELTSPLKNPDTRIHPPRPSIPLQNITNFPPSSNFTIAQKVMGPKPPIPDPTQQHLNPQNLNPIQLPFSAHADYSSSRRGKEKRRSQSPLVTTKRSRIMLDENMHLSLALLHIQTSPDHSPHPLTDNMQIINSTTTMLAEERISIVRRRFIHVKRMARNTYHSQLPPDSIQEIIDDSPVQSTTLKAEEAGLKMPPTPP